MLCAVFVNAAHLLFPHSAKQYAFALGTGLLISRLHFITNQPSSVMGDWRIVH